MYLHIARSEPDGTWWRMGGEVKGKDVNGVGSQQPCTVHRNTVYTIADPHSSTASSQLNWHPHRFKWTCTFRWKPNLVSVRVPSRFECAIPYSIIILYHLIFSVYERNNKIIWTVYLVSSIRHWCSSVVVFHIVVHGNDIIIIIIIFFFFFYFL